MKRLSLPNYVRRTGAKFESTERFLKNTVVVDTTETHLKSAGVPLTRIDGNTYATTQDELHCFVIGESGCGKTRRVILPTIQLMAKTGQSMVISDPKGELYRTTADALKKQGYSVLVLNFRNPSRGNRWNPLGLIEKFYRSADPENKDKASMMLSDLVNVLAQSIEGDDPYWAKSAASVFRGISYIILDYGKEGDLTFENIAIGARDLLKELTSGMGRRPSGRLQSFLDALPKGSTIVNNLSCVITNAEDTRNCIMSSFESMISLYSSQESLLDLFSCSEIDVSRLGIEPSALFIILPDDNESLYPIATVFVKQIYSALISLADEQLDGKLPNRVTFLLDEFANFAKMPSIESMLTAARSRAIRFVLVCQSMDQLTAKYKDHGRETLLANCRTWIYMSCRNLPFLQRLEQLMGYYVSPYTNDKTPLVDIGDLQHFEMGQVLILNDRCRPVMGWLEDYDDYQFGDNKGVVLPLPDKHEIKTRNIFDLADAMVKCQKTKYDNSSEENPVNPFGFGALFGTEEDGLRASIFGKLAERRREEEHEEKSEIDVTSLIRQIDAKIAELEEQENDSKEDDDLEDTAVISDNDDEDDESPDMMTLFCQGDYIGAANICIKDILKNNFISGENIPLKNNLAFLIRYGHLNPDDLRAPFPLDITVLLEEGVEANDDFSLLNMALYEISQMNYEKAESLLNQISHWNPILSFWYYSLWKDTDAPEGALVALLSKKYAPGLVLSDIDECKKVALKIYPEFVNTYLADQISEKKNDTEGFNWLQSLLSDDETDEDGDEGWNDDKEEDDDDGSESSGFEFLKAQLQKKIQNKLKAQQNEDEE